MIKYSKVITKKQTDTIIKMAGNVGQFIVPVKKRKLYRYSYRGGSSSMTKICDAFNRFDTLDEFKDDKLIDRISSSPLGHMWTSLKNFRFKSPAIYNILVRAVVSEEEDEMLFRLGDKTCRFGRREFALISGLSMKPLPHVDVCNGQALTSSMVAIPDPITSEINLTEKRPFKGLSKVTQSMLEEVLTSSNDRDVVLKVGLIYLIDVCFHGKKSHLPVDPFLFSLVEDIGKFLSYPWGTYFWEISLNDWKDVVLPVKEPGENDDPTNSTNRTILGLVNVLFAWGCETLPESVRFMFAINQNLHKPRVLRWNHKEERLSTKNTRLEFEGLVTGAKGFLIADDDEVNLLRSCGFTDEEINMPPPLYPDLVVDEPDDVQQLPQTETGLSHSQAGASQSFEALESRIMERIEMVLSKYLEKLEEKVSTLDQKVDFLIKDVDEGRSEQKIGLQETKNELMREMNGLLAAISFDKNQEQFPDHNMYSSGQFGHGHEKDQSQQNQFSQSPSSAHMHAANFFEDLPPVNVNDVMGATDTFLGEALQSADVERGMKDTHHAVDDDTNVIPYAKKKVTKRAATTLVGKDVMSAGDERGQKDKRLAVDDDINVIPPSKKRVIKRAGTTKGGPKTIKGKLGNFGASLKRLQNFIQSPDPSMMIPGPFVDESSVVDLDGKFFKELLTNGGYIQTKHVDCYLNLMKRRMAKYHDSYDPNAILLFSTFPLGITSEDHWNEDNLLYTLDISKLNVTPNTTLFAPWYTSSKHWLAVSMSVAKWEMRVYDIRVGIGNVTGLDNILSCWAGRMRAVLKKCNGVKDMPKMMGANGPPFKVIREQRSLIPQMQGTTGDSGIFTLKHLEALISGGEIPKVVEGDMHRLRQEMAIELYNQIV